ncbi:MAG: hypothetical protein ACD_46C00693G0004, partial [uncultured bacterium]
LDLAAEYLNRYPINLNCGLRVLAATILDWDNNELKLKYCNGLNVEHALRYCKNSELWVLVMRELIEAFRQRGFLWGDIAPRNMVIDFTACVIYIFDFEKKFKIEDCSTNKKIFSRFFRSYAYEEMSCFLNYDNQKILFRDYLSENIDCEINVANIISNRKKGLLYNIFGAKECYLVSELQTVEDIMSLIATPFVIGNTNIFPMLLIDEHIKKGGIYGYTEIVKQLIDCKSVIQRFSVLKSLNEGFFINDG